MSLVACLFGGFDVTVRPGAGVVNLCHIHLSPRKQLHPFICTNQFFFLATSQLTESLHVLSCSTDASQHQYQKHNMCFTLL